MVAPDGDKYVFMKQLRMILIAGAALVCMSADWRTDFSKALDDARKKDKLVLLQFSGSDWCVPCIRMEKGLFASDTFQAFAAGHLEMVHADFPRLSKNKLSKTVQAQNETLAERYDKEGHFPYTVLLDADGKVLKTWDGYVGTQPPDFIRQIAAFAGK